MFTHQPEIYGGSASSPPPPQLRAPDLSGVSSFGRFTALIIARADLSRAASRVAVGKAARADVKEFAGYELQEAETIVSVEDLGIPVPPRAADSSATHDVICSRLIAFSG